MKNAIIVTGEANVRRAIRKATTLTVYCGATDGDVTVHKNQFLAASFDLSTLAAYVFSDGYTRLESNVDR